MIYKVCLPDDHRSSKKAYSTLKTFTKTSQPKASCISNADWNLLTEIATVLNRWDEYSSDLYNYPLQPDSSLLQIDPGPVSHPYLRQSNTETVHINSTGSSKETTAASTTEASIVRTTSPNGVDGIWVTAISQGHFSGITENNTTLLFEYFTNETTVLNNKSHGNRETTEFTTVQNALLYQKFIIIIGSLAVAVVLIAASVLICGYRKYYHLSDALELATATTDVPVDTFQRTSIPMLEDVPDNRHSTLEIYETIPMTNVSPLSPMADSYPLTQEVRILANLFEFGSESSVGSLHYYETVPDTINNDVASSDGAEENTSVHAPTHVLYESLLRSSTDVKEQYTTKASS
ncbi:uncharacterized protein LOC127869828 [Dreissena polymorpha]|uniref:uncharacterized protein LOC127869828 n=1 Tax=Dreissena polymorpha TaxID=45954 RepID=UPI0022653AA8|nr:uncharacterized protein LOC127869828 [Dreissena polymorpha]